MGGKIDTVNLVCLYFATRFNFKQIINKKLKIQNVLENKNANAHSWGKTTVHRHGAKDAKKSKVRTACIKLDKVLFYKRQLEKMPELREYIEGVRISTDLLNPWLYGDMPSSAFKKYFN